VIERPKRSVTRFFIPLIDVMILLFCIFLLMPFMSQPGNAESTDAKKAPPEKSLTPEEMAKQLANLRSSLELAQRDLKRLQEERANPTERLSILVLEIDPKTGELFYYRDGTRIAVPDQRAAQDVISDHNRRSGVTKDPYFLIMLPRELTGYPSAPQKAQYEKWFKDVPHRFDNPLGSR
jgi:hypothetical protein